MSESAESSIPGIVQLPPEVFIDNIFPPSPPHIVQIGLEEINSLVVSSPTPVVLEHIEEVPVPKESIPIPLVHIETAGSIEDVEMVEHPPIVQEGSNVDTMP